MSNQNIIERINPADSFTLAMDQEIRNDGLPGSYGCFALEFISSPNIPVLQSRIKELSERFPIILSSLQQHGKHFFWCKREKAPELFFQHHCPSNQEEDAFHKNQIDSLINYRKNREHISPMEFHFITGPQKHTLLIRWIHPFCDARGTELILKFLCADDINLRMKFGTPETKPLVNIQLEKYRWWQKINLFFKGKNFIKKLDALPSIQPLTNTKGPKKLNFLIQRLTESESQQVIQLARKHVGITGISLYYIGCLMRALDTFYTTHQGEAYCVPYAFNLRKQRAVTPMTGNHICALFAQAPRNILDNREELFNYLKKQNHDVIRNQQDYAFLPLMWAGSWLSLNDYGKVLRLTDSGSERSSFWFSDIGQLNFPNNKFIDSEIKSIFHMCQVTTPPGLAFLSCIYKDRLTFSYSFIEPLTNCEQIKMLQDIVRLELLGQS